MAGRSEYSKLRDIARKRNIRLVEQGLSAPMNIPRLRDIRNDPQRVAKELQKLRDYVNQEATVRNVKKSGTPFFNHQIGLPPFGLEGRERKAQKRGRGRTSEQGNVTLSRKQSNRFRTEIRKRSRKQLRSLDGCGISCGMLRFLG